MNREVRLDNDIVIKGAALLTFEETKELPKITREIGDWWWHSPGYYCDNVVYVGSCGQI